MPSQKAKSDPISRDQLADRLYHIGQVELRMEDIETRMNRRLDRIRSDYTEDLERLRGEHGRLMQQLRIVAEDSRQHLLATTEGKTISTLFGDLQFRRQPIKVILRTGNTTEDVVDILERHGLAECVRVTKALDKAELNRRAREGELDEAHVADLGLVITGGDEDVVVTINRDSVRDHQERGK